MTREYNDRRSSILEAMAEGSRLLNEIAWDLAIRGGRVEPFDVATLPPDSQLPRSDYESTRRAARELVEDGKILVVRRRLTSSELIRYYPYQTRTVRIAYLRRHLLTPLFRFAMTTTDTSKREFSSAEVEQHALITKASEQTSDFLRSRWSAVSEQLLEVENRLPSERRLAILALRVKCTELFETSEVRHRLSLGDLIRNFAASAALPLEFEALSIVRALYNEMPLAEIDQAALKVALYRAIDIRARRRAAMREPGKEALYAAAPAILRSLPGFSENERKLRFMRERKEGEWMDTFEEYKLQQEPDAFHSPLLDHLISRDMFRPFQFVERARG